MYYGKAHRQHTLGSTYVHHQWRGAASSRLLTKHIIYLGGGGIPDLIRGFLDLSMG